MDWLTDPQIWAGLLTLTVLEIVLGIDNLVFIAVLAGRVRLERQALARKLGLGLALVTRLLLLAGISEMVRLTAPMLVVRGHSFSGHDLILIAGGLFLLFKGTTEIHRRIEGESDTANRAVPEVGLAGVVLQIGLLDVVFSLDSVITAVGMINDLSVMIAAVGIAMVIMLLASGPTTAFVERHPTVKMLVFSFLLLIGMALLADGFGMHVPRGYIYAAIGFSAGVELLNQLARRRQRRAEPDRPASGHFDESRSSDI